MQAIQAAAAISATIAAQQLLACAAQICGNSCDMEALTNFAQLVVQSQASAGLICGETWDLEALTHFAQLAVQTQAAQQLAAAAEAAEVASENPDGPEAAIMAATTDTINLSSNNISSNTSSTSSNSSENTTNTCNNTSNIFSEIINNSTCNNTSNNNNNMSNSNIFSENINNNLCNNTSNNIISNNNNTSSSNNNNLTQNYAGDFASNYSSSINLSTNHSSNHHLNNHLNNSQNQRHQAPNSLVLRGNHNHQRHQQHHHISPLHQHQRQHHHQQQQQHLQQQHHQHHHLSGHHHHSSIQTQQQLMATNGFNPLAVVGPGSQTQILTPIHLKKAKLMFFYVRYPQSATLKDSFRDVQFNKNNTAQLVKWFSNFREYYYIQMEKFARDAIKDNRIQRMEDIIVGHDHELINALNNHYNKNRHIELPEEFRKVVEETLRHFFDAIHQKRDTEQSWKKAIYKIIARLDCEVPELFKTEQFHEILE